MLASLSFLYSAIEHGTVPLVSPWFLKFTPGIIISALEFPRVAKSSRTLKVLSRSCGKFRDHRALQSLLIAAGRPSQIDKLAV